jgi:CBS domain-containing protein/glycosyltransferase involved in cell wall biosynthesis
MGKINSYLVELLNLPVQTNMKTNPPTTSHLDLVSKIVDSMVRENVGAVVVEEDDRPVGIITERDVLERVIKPQKDFELTPARDVMSRPIITIEAGRPISEALEVMRVNNIRRLVVVDDGALVGLTTERRLLEVAHTSYMASALDIARRTRPFIGKGPLVAFVSTYPPRECGIATYTQDLVDAIYNLHVLRPPVVAAINDRGGHYDYTDIVKSQIDRERLGSYIEAAEHINASDIEVVNLQHEYGLFGGVWGEYVIDFLEELKKPVVTTLHTVLQEPSLDARRVIMGILQHSDYVVVMARVGKQILEQLYDTYPDQVRYIPHGCPNVPFISSDMVKQRMGLKDRIVLSTFGLLSRGKGIEYAIQALPEVVKLEPRALYLIIGETHPEVRKHDGEEYRQSLYDLVESLGLEGNVRFVNRFLPKGELISYLQATDVYILPYPNREQISSGTLLYALSTGKAIVSTPFLHAGEVISDGCALECGFRDPGSITECVQTLLKYGDVLGKFERRAYRYSRDMIWPNVAMQYVNLFYETLGL